MSKFKLEIHPEGFNQARHDPRIQADLMRRANAIRAAAGGTPEDFTVVDSPHAARARVVVLTTSYKGMLAEARHRALSRAFNAGQG